MYLDPRVFTLIRQLGIQSKKKLSMFRNIVALSIFALFLGFVCGNLFGTFLNYFRHFFKWDGFIISITILFIEIINYITFKTGISFENQLADHSEILQKPNLGWRTRHFKQWSLNPYSGIKIVNFYKIGLLLGFFIDAFKVGS